MTRHENRFGITSFIYRARLPFHPGRLYDYFLDPFFIFHGSRKEEIEETSKLEKLQRDAGLKQERRSKHLGGLMRSKGFVWIATSQYFMGAWQQAGFLDCLSKKLSFRQQRWRCVQLFCNTTTKKVSLY